MIDNLALPHRNLGFYATWMQNRALLGWMHGPLLQSNRPGFDRRLMVWIWHMRRQASQLAFVDMQADVLNAEWTMLRVLEAKAHVFRNWLPFVSHILGSIVDYALF